MANTAKALTSADCVRLKAEGNSAYAAGETDSAIVSYTEALDIWNEVVRSSPQTEAFGVGDRVLYKYDKMTTKQFGEITQTFMSGKECFIKDLPSGKMVWENGKEGGHLQCFDRADVTVVSKEMFDLQLACLQNLAMAYLKMDFYNEAVNWADHALNMDPQAPKALMRKGVALLRGGIRLSRAQRVLTLANEVSPKDREVQKALEEVKKLREARAKITRPRNLSNIQAAHKWQSGCVCCVEAPSSDENDYTAPKVNKSKVMSQRAMTIDKNGKTVLRDLSKMQAEGDVEKPKMVDSQVQAKVTAKPSDSKPKTEEKVGTSSNEAKGKAPEQNIKTEISSALNEWRSARPAARTDKACSDKACSDKACSDKADSGDASKATIPDNLRRVSEGCSSSFHDDHQQFMSDLHAKDSSIAASHGEEGNESNVRSSVAHHAGSNKKTNSGDGRFFCGPVDRSHWEKVPPSHRTLPSCIDEATFVRIHFHVVQRALQILEAREAAIRDFIVETAATQFLCKVLQLLHDDQQLRAHFSRHGADFWKTVTEKNMEDWANKIVSRLASSHQEMQATLLESLHVGGNSESGSAPEHSRSVPEGRGSKVEARGPSNSESLEGLHDSAKTLDTSSSQFRHLTGSWLCASIAGAAGAIFCAIALSRLDLKI